MPPVHSVAEGSADKVQQPVQPEPRPRGETRAPRRGVRRAMPRGQILLLGALRRLRRAGALAFSRQPPGALGVCGWLSAGVAEGLHRGGSGLRVLPRGVSSGSRPAYGPSQRAKQRPRYAVGRRQLEDGRRRAAALPLHANAEARCLWRRWGLANPGFTEQVSIASPEWLRLEAPRGGQPRAAIAFQRRGSGWRR